MCMGGDAKRGVICAECLDPVKFLGMMADMGGPVKFNEVVSKKVSLEQTSCSREAKNFGIEQERYYGNHMGIDNCMVQEQNL